MHAGLLSSRSAASHSFSSYLHPAQLLDPIGPSGSRAGGASASQQQLERASRAQYRAQRGHSTLKNTTDLKAYPMSMSLSAPKQVGAGERVGGGGGGGQLI